MTVGSSQNFLGQKVARHTAKTHALKWVATGRELGLVIGPISSWP